MIHALPAPSGASDPRWSHQRVGFWDGTVLAAEPATAAARQAGPNDHEQKGKMMVHPSMKWWNYVEQEELYGLCYFFVYDILNHNRILSVVGYNHHKPYSQSHPPFIFVTLPLRAPKYRCDMMWFHPLRNKPWFLGVFNIPGPGFKIDNPPAPSLFSSLVRIGFWILYNGL